jgi:hypothetical protein
MTQSIADQLNEAQARRKKNARWINACGGDERPMVVQGVRVLYCWNGLSGPDCEHAYLNLDTDMIMVDGEFEALCGR